jgi:cytochrome c biogenesis protein CcdA/glutaredoxin
MPVARRRRSLAPAAGAVRRALLLLVLLCAVAPAVSPALAQDAESVDLVLFYGRGCPYCAAMREYLATVRQDRPEIRLHEYEVYFSSDNALLFQQMADAYGTEIEGVPTLFVGDAVIVGFSEEMRPLIARAIDRCKAEACASPLERISGSAELPTLTLTAVVVAALVDAINPCAFAVLILLITAVLGAGHRLRVLYSGLAFSLAIFISYYLMGLGLYSAVAAAGVTEALYVVVGVLAILIGLFNLKDYLWYGKWFVMEVPLSWRPTLQRIIHRVTSAPGAFLTGFVVSLFLLPCTSGPYIVIIGLLGETAERAGALLWLLLYNAIFIAPMIAITAAVYFGLTTAEKAEAWRSRHLRALHLVAGTVILLLGVAMLTMLWLGKV